MTELGTRKGFYFQRLEGGRVRIRVQVGQTIVVSNAGQESDVLTEREYIPSFREVELTAAEWVDVVTAVSDRPADATTHLLAVDLHMGEAGDGL